MRRQIAGVGALVCLFTVVPAYADGLIFQLPPDGTWARYTMTTEAEFKLSKRRMQKITIVGTLTVSSVGEVRRNEQKCRWIEMKWESENRGVHRKLLLKLLIPEEYLRRGEDPLSHVVLTFFDPKAVDQKKAPSVESFIGEGFNRIQYEIDRFRDMFPKPLDNLKRLKPELINTRAGKFEDCEVVTGTSSYDGQLMNIGRSVYKGTYRMVLHPKAPFGVVAMYGEMEGHEISPRSHTSLKAKKTLILMEIGKNAVSELFRGRIGRNRQQAEPSVAACGARCHREFRRLACFEQVAGQLDLQQAVGFFVTHFDRQITHRDSPVG